MVLLTLSASVPTLKPGAGKVTTTQLGVFYLALYLIALGTGGIKPCVSSFGADQFDENDPKEKKRKSSFFNWFYFSINVGALVSSSALVYIQMHVGWGWGFGVPAVAMALAIGSFFFGSRLYRHQKPGGSPITRVVQVLVASARNWRAKVSPTGENLYDLHDKESGIQGSRKLQHTPAFR
jgi:peptide/histidine transporter 3/4